MGPTREPLADPGSVMTGGLLGPGRPPAARPLPAFLRACRLAVARVARRWNRAPPACSYHAPPCRVEELVNPVPFVSHAFRCRTTLILADYTDSFRIGLRTAGEEWRPGRCWPLVGRRDPAAPLRGDGCRLRPRRRPPPSSHGATPAALVARLAPPPSPRRNVGLVRGGGIGPDCPARLRLWQHGRHLAAQSTPGRHPARPVGHGGCRWPGSARHGQRVRPPTLALAGGFGSAGDFLFAFV